MSCSSKQRINNGELRMSILSKIPIFDIDTHFTEPKDLWTSRAPAKYKERVMHVRRDASGQDSWFIEGHNVAPIGLVSSIAKATKCRDSSIFPITTRCHWPRPRLRPAEAYG